jgi:phosphopantetheinyl transferase
VSLHLYVLPIKSRDPTRQSDLSILFKKYLAIKLAVLHTQPISRNTITINAYGKPEADYGFFSISHSNDYMVGVIHPTKAVGVDLQYIHGLSDNNTICNTDRYRSYIKRMASPQEWGGVAQNTVFNATQFCLWWAKKEAYLKYLGVGFANSQYKHTYINQENFQVLPDCTIYAQAYAKDYILAICIENN